MRRESGGRSGGRARGIALVVVCGILAILVTLAAAFAAAAASRRQMAGAQAGAAGARLLARSGVEYAMSRLTRGWMPRPGPASYGDDWTFRDAPGTPLQRALNPSYNNGDRYFDANGTGRFDAGIDPVVADREGDGAYQGWSGRLRGWHRPFGNRFSLRIEDESGKININGGFLDDKDRDADGVRDHRDPAVGPAAALPGLTGRGWNHALRRVLDLLGTSVGVPALGTKVMTHRPVGGYGSVDSFEEVLRSVYGIRRDLSGHLTVSSWVDRSVVRPNAYASAVATASLSDVKLGRAPLLPEEGGRPPVNLNTARREILVPLIQGLSGETWHDPLRGPVRYTIATPAMAGAVADSLILRRPFADWEGFARFCDSLAGTTITGMNAPFPNSAWGGGNLCGADLLKANFNPNARLNKEVPDGILWQWIDKSDLLVPSTEGCLEPTGAFRVESYGAVAAVRGDLRACAGVDTVLRLFSPLRQTTQADFVGGRGLDDLPGEPRYLSLADPAISRTTGSAPGCAWNRWGPGRGLAVVTRPCGPVSLPAGASALDGSVGLATVEAGEGDPPGGTLRFLHHFDDGWDADVGAPSLRADGMNDDRLQGAVATPAWPAPPQEPGTFYPDGFHTQFRRAPSFESVSNLGGPGGRYGAVGFWVKGTASTNALMPWFHCVREAGFDPGPPPSRLTQALQIAQQSRFVGLLVESAAQVGDAGAERQVHLRPYAPNTNLFPDVRWRLVTVLWDLDDTILGQDAWMAYDGFPGVASMDLGGGAYAGAPFVPAIAQDLAAAGVRFDLGGQDNPNHVEDEFAICDFGPDGAAALAAARAWGDDRLAQGRYYKGNDGTFLSVRIDPFPGARGRLLAVSWTQALPSDARMDLAMTAGVPATGTPRPSDPDLRDARVEVELLDPSGAPLSPPLRPASGGPIGIPLGTMRYAVRFLPTPTWDAAKRLNAPVLESPHLDDVTFLLQAPSGPLALLWREGE